MSAFYKTFLLSGLASEAVLTAIWIGFLGYEAIKLIGTSFSEGPKSYFCRRSMELTRRCNSPNRKGGLLIGFVLYDEKGRPCVSLSRPR